MNRRALIIWSVVVAVVGGVAAVPFLLPLDTYRGSIERTASRALGRDVKVAGPVHFTVYPNIGISLSDVSIANAPGARQPQMVSVAKTTVAARLMPLFSGRLEVTGIVLDRPVIRLEMNKDGQPNWQIVTAQTQGQGGAVARTPPTDATQLNRIGVSDVRIEGGEISYFDARSGKTDALQNVSLRLSLPNGARTLATRLTVNGTLTYNSEELKITNSYIDNLDALLKSRGTGAHVAISSRIINADFVGTVGTPGRVTGALKMGARSLRAFANWVGHPMPPGNGFGLIALEGQVVQDGDVFTLRQTHLAFDSMNVNGNISFDTKSEPVAINGHATIDRLDVTPYLASGTEEDTVAANKAKAANPDGRIALDWLKSANADLTLVVGAFVLPNFKLDHAVIKAALKDGLLKADMDNLSVYGGNGKASIAVDATASTPTFKSTLDLSGIKAQPFLDELVDVKRISGTGAVRVDVTSRGETPSAVLKSLSGKGDIRLTNGSVSGADLAAVSRIVQSVLTAQVITDAIGTGEATSFTQLGASFVIRDGVLHTNDLLLNNPEVQIRGRGDVDLAEKQLDLHFEPRALKGIPGVRLVDIGVPFTVKGPWAKPSFVPDAGGIAKGVINKLQQGAATPLDLINKPGATLKSLLGGSN